MNIQSMVNLYPISKTLRFELQPVGKTRENFELNKMLEADESLAEKYTEVKKYIDEYHKAYIEKRLSGFRLDGVREYAELYYNRAKSNDRLKKMEKAEQKMRNDIADVLKKGDEYSRLSEKELITELLPTILNDEQKEIASAFDLFSTYFTGFNQNRENMYSSDAKSTAISYRCINENLPKFLDNCRNFATVKEALPEEIFEELNENFEGLYGCRVEDIFSVDYFSNVLSQSGIDNYNYIIGGYTTSDGEKVQGINEAINLFSQSSKIKLPKMKILFKQILSDRESISFIPEQFADDNDMLRAVYKMYTEDMDTDDGEKIKSVSYAVSEIKELFENVGELDCTRLYIKNGLAVTDISKKLTDYWGTVQEKWFEEYDETHLKKGKGITEKYEETRRKEYNAVPSFSLKEIDRLTGKSTAEYYSEAVGKAVGNIGSMYSEAEALLKNEYREKKSFAKNDEAIATVKNFLDPLKELEGIIKPLLGSGKEAEKDDVFYGTFMSLYENLHRIDRLYDRVRNYVTKKPYSTDKIKLNFGNPVFLDGWASNLEFARSAQMFKDEKYFYLAVMDKGNKNSIPKEYDSPIDKNDAFYKMIYQQMASPSKDIPNLMVIDGITVKKTGRKEKSGIHAGENLILEELRNSYIPEEINRIRKTRSFSKNSEYYSKEDLTSYIEYYKERVIEYYSSFNFNFKKSEEYASYADFLSDVDGQAYQIKFSCISRKQIMDLADSGALYLFRIYNKDFSEHSKGKPNLHTLYFKMLFDERNLADVVYQLNGGAEMFYRKPSISKEEMIVHPANCPIDNKNTASEKKTSTFSYDIIKDKRYTEPKFFLHVPIKLNFKADGLARLNDMVRAELKKSEENYVIGIDRGERNLLYICVINSKGEIVLQESLNEIVSRYNGNEYRVDYHQKLDDKERERQKSRQNWTTVNNIKELKEGYISQVVHRICELVVKYNAVIAMEDLNSGFKNSRIKVEKQVYQKFENMLTSKLRFLASKTGDPEAVGGLLKAYQLTNDSKVKTGLQNGIIFYIPAWLTSKIDPVTGFVDLLKPKYRSREEAKEFIGRFNSISFNAEENYFEFDFYYKNFPKGVTDYRDHWTVCTYGERIETFRNPEKNSEWDSRTVDITEGFKKLFEEYGIDYRSGDLKKAITKQNSKEFFKSVLHLLGLTLQMRNSKTGTDIDYLISPVKSPDGTFYFSDQAPDSLPQNADANGAYNIARKALWAIEWMKEDEDETKTKLSIKNSEWLEYAQR